MEECSSGGANAPSIGVHHTVSVCETTVGNVLLTANVSQPGESSKATVSGVAAPVLEDGPSAGNRLLLPALDPGALSPVEVCSDDAIRAHIPVGPTIPGLSMPDVHDAPSITAHHEPGPSRCGLGPTIHNTTSLPVTLATVTKHVDASVSFELRSFPTVSPPSQGTSEAVITGFPDQPTGSNPRAVAQGRSDATRPTFSNPPPFHIPEQVYRVRPNGLDGPPPSRPMFSDTGDSLELGISNLEGYTGQPSTPAVDVTSSPTSPGIHTPVKKSNPPELMGGLEHENPLTPTGSEEEIIDHLLQTSESLPGVTHIADQAVGSVELRPLPVPRVPPQTLEQSNPPVIKEAGECVEEPVISPVEEPVISSVEEPVISPVEEYVSSVAKDLVTPSDEVLNSVPAERVIPLAAVVQPTGEPTGESITQGVEDPVTLIDDIPNPSATNRINSRVLGESSTPQFPFTLTDNPQPPSRPQVADTAVGALSIVAALEPSGIMETASLTCQGREEEDEPIIDDILSLRSDSRVPSQPPRDAAEPTTQETDQNSSQTTIPEVVTASVTDTEPDSTPNPSNLTIPSTARRPQPLPVLPQEVITPAPYQLPREADGVTADGPLSMEHITQESTTPAAPSVFKTFWSGALQELTMAKKSLQHAFVTPRRPLPVPPVDMGPGATPSSPIVEGGFWDPGIEGTQGEPQTDFVRACRTGERSPVDPRGNEELPRRRVSLQQGTDPLLVCHPYTFLIILNKQVTRPNLDATDLQLYRPPKREWMLQRLALPPLAGRPLRRIILSSHIQIQHHLGRQMGATGVPSTEREVYDLLSPNSSLGSPVLQCRNPRFNSSLGSPALTNLSVTGGILHSTKKNHQPPILGVFGLCGPLTCQVISESVFVSCRSCLCLTMRTRELLRCTVSQCVWPVPAIQ